MRKATRPSFYSVIDTTALVCVGIAVAVPCSRYWLPREVAQQQSSIYVASSAVHATLLGFMIASLTILLTIGGRRLTKVYVASPLYRKTLSLFHGTAVWLAIATVVALAGLFIDKQPPAPQASLPASSLWIWASLATGLIVAWRFFFALSVLRDVTELVAADQVKPQPPKSKKVNQNPPAAF